MTNETKTALAEQATALLTNMQADLSNAATRNEWLRLSMLAAECERLVASIREVS